MGYILIAAAALWLVLWASGGGRVLKRREWRITSAAFALAAFIGAAATIMRGEWPAAAVLLIMGLWLASSARVRGAAQPKPPPRETMSAAEARSILGVSPEASREEIQAAYSRLMRLAHPDKGGTTGLAAQLNAARARLLGR